LTAFSQLAQSKTEPPAGSAARNWSSARFGFGGAETRAALQASSSPAPIEPAAAFGAFRVVRSSAPLT